MTKFGGICELNLVNFLLKGQISAEDSQTALENGILTAKVRIRFIMKMPHRTFSIYLVKKELPLYVAYNLAH